MDTLGQLNTGFGLAWLPDGIPLDMVARLIYFETKHN